MKQLYFMRHGESEANARNICAGHTDVPLTVLGRKQAVRAGHHIKESHIPIDLIISSPLQRALATAQEVARIIHYPCDAIIIHDDAIERFRGNLEGQPSEKQDGLSQEAFAQYGAESEEAMIERSTRLLHFIQQRPEQSILLVSHNQFGRTFIAHCHGQSWNHVAKLPNAHIIPVTSSHL